MKPTNFTHERCLAYAFLSKMGDLKLQFATQVGSPKEYAYEFEQLADQLESHLSVWRNTDDELPPDEVECIFETYDGWVFVGDYREKRDIVNHRHGYEMIEDIKRWKPLSLKSEVQE